MCCLGSEQQTQFAVERSRVALSLVPWSCNSLVYIRKQEGPSSRVEGQPHASGVFWRRVSRGSNLMRTQGREENPKLRFECRNRKQSRIREEKKENEEVRERRNFRSLAVTAFREQARSVVPFHGKQWARIASGTAIRCRRDSTQFAKPLIRRASTRCAWYRRHVSQSAAKWGLG